MNDFNGILDTFLGRISSDDFRQMEKTVRRFKGKLVKVINDSDGKFDGYSISSKIKQILLHWGYELTEKDLFI